MLSLYLIIWLRWSTQIDATGKLIDPSSLSHSSGENEAERILFEQLKGNEENEQGKTENEREKQHHPPRRWQKLKAAFRLLLYPVAFFVVWLPNLITLIFYGNDAPFALAFVRDILFGLLGFFDALIFLFTMRVTCWNRLWRKRKVDYEELALNYEPFETSRERWEQGRKRDVPSNK